MKKAALCVALAVIATGAMAKEWKTVRIGVDPVECIDKCGDRLHDLHIKDESEAAPKGKPTEVGKGVIDIVAILNAVAVYKIGIHRFGFVIPLAAVALIELIALALFHATAYQVIRIVILGAAAALIVALVTDPEGRAPA